MPLLMCPNDNAQMQTLDRGGVQFDMCPTCRGVWLDRGELEKLMEQAAATAAPAAAQPAYAPPPQAAPQPGPWGQPQQPQPPQYGYRDQPRYRDDDDYRYRKKKRDSIFDIFD
ncbi:TFIIB-type zinc ribbon-containing protein [Brevundimonas bacteroides]|uniref:TFIIB-type zinc ribbon-containing protein n=1 Tax=Brevundimonas bacteroides TaxID=74311 RepID=UPI000494F3BA|nr:zf-TFIIB domain-containing protein [Brevundimonas bacteroides]